MIEQRKISLISNKAYQNSGRRIPESLIERDYCLSWFLFGLAYSPLKEKLIFKGGTALRRCYFQDYRFSEDLDFTLIDETSLDKILKEFEKIFMWTRDESGIAFEHVRQELSTENTHTFYISYIGPLPGKEKEVKVDIAFKEKIIHQAQEKGIIKTYEEYSDFLSEPMIRVYSLEEVAIEKICALFSPSRNEPRDLYDIHYLIEEAEVDISRLINDIDEKMKLKGSSLSIRRNEFLKKEKRLKKLWQQRLSQQMDSLPEYNDVFRMVKRAFRQAELLTLTPIAPR